MKQLLSITIFFILSVSCNSQDCKKLPENFSSYSQAVTAVKSSSYSLKEIANTSSSSWMTSAIYYSCDGNYGYFIYTTNKGNEYIHKGVPIYIWNGFKEASSKGTFYNNEIKGKYLLNVSSSRSLN